MAGRILLTIEGIKDLNIEGTPSITFFKSIYKQYSPFSFEQVNLSFDGSLKEGDIISFDIPKDGDLLYKSYLSFDWTTSPISGFSHICELFTKIEFTVDGKVVDSISSWNLYCQHQKLSNTEQYKTIISMNTVCSLNQRNVIIPLTFFFTTSPGNALPLLALHDSKLSFRLYLSQTRTSTNIFDIITPSIWIEYIYLSEKESKKLIQEERKMLIIQHQNMEPEKLESSNQKIRLNFRHYVKEIFWFVYEHNNDIPINDGKITDDPPNFKLSVDLNFDEIEILVGGSPIFQGRNKMFYTLLNYYNYYKRCPADPSNPTKIDNFYLFSYSFALDPNQYQPNGIFNFNFSNKYEIQFHDLILDNNKKYIVLFANSYNFFKIKNKKGILLLI